MKATPFKFVNPVINILICYSTHFKSMYNFYYLFRQVYSHIEEYRYEDDSYLRCESYLSLGSSVLCS